MFAERTCGFRRLITANLLAAAVTFSLAAQADPDSRNVAKVASTDSLERAIESLESRIGPGILNITSSIIGHDRQNQPVPGEGIGTGWVYDANGHVVTNFHVIKNAQFVMVTLPSGDTYQADIVGTDPSSDLAVLHIDPQHLPPPLELQNEDALRVGMFVVALGNPFGLNRTLTFGVISALKRVIRSPDGSFVGEAIQTDTPINPGNSGGPLVDLTGKVVGITSQILSPSGTSSGIGFAIPSNLIARVVPMLIRQGHYEHPYLGIQAVSLNPVIAKIIGQQAGKSFPAASGALVVKVSSGSPASRAGIKGSDRTVTVYGNKMPLGGDLIVAVNGNPIRGFEELAGFVESEQQVGDTVALTLYRGDRRMTVDAKLTARPTTGQ